MEIVMRRRSPQEVEAYLEEHAADLAAALPDPAAREDFKRMLIEAAHEHYGRERLIPGQVS